jgi:hypothetical protein
MHAGALSQPAPVLRPSLALSAAPPPLVRQGVRALLADQQGFAALDDSTRRDLAGGLVRIGAAALANDDVAGTRPPAPPVLARAQGNAGQEFSGVAVDRVAGTTQAVLNAVSFPRFVTELITGVFKAMNDSNQQQLTAFVDLIRNVATTTEGFADANVGISGARAWLAEKFPTSYEIQGGEADDFPEDLSRLDPEERRQRQAEIQAERDAATRIQLRPGGTAPTEAALRAAFGDTGGQSLSGSNPEALVPLARQILARNRQQLLSTMIQMGLQRIVIDSGRLNAAMKFHIDASSAAANDRGSQFDMRNTVEAGVGAKFGPWGVEAKVQNTIGYVSTDRTQTTEGINTSVDLDSGVELIFHTDYVPLGRLAGVGDVERIRVNALNPEAEAARMSAERTARDTARASETTARAGRLDTALRTPPAPPAMTGTIDTSRMGVAPGTTPPPPVTPPGQTPVTPPGQTPVTPPGQTPVTPPGQTPVTPPGQTPVTPPGQTPVTPPGQTPVTPPGQTPVRPPGQTPVTPPGQTPVTPPGQAPVTPPGQAPVTPPGQAPVTPPGQTPVRPPAQTPVTPPGQTPVTPPGQTPVTPPGQAPVTPPGQTPGTPPTPGAGTPPPPAKAPPVKPVK